MAKENWKALQIEYLKANARTGISIKDWCEKKGLKFATAKRYIKKPETVFNSSKNSEKNCEIENTEKSDKTTSYQENCELNCETESETAKQQTISQVNSQKARKHGGYARYFKDKSAFDVVVDFSLKDEIDLMRQRAVSAVESIEKFSELLTNAETAEDKELYSKLIDSAGNALDRAVARIESLNYTDNSIANILSQIELRKVQAKKVIAETDKLEQEIKTKSRGLKDSVVYNIEF
ncbi:terminase [Histophilus somni]|uniref:terminase n=1 Tax=Histophilus somni TaxID=731 RepID=UPI00094AD018|nr:terminase [Histophilus somni]